MKPYTTEELKNSFFADDLEKWKSPKLEEVDWENIDPDLLRTKRNLEDAQARVASLKTRADAETQQEVREEIEKLEEFVTSSKFAYYDQAAKGS